MVRFPHRGGAPQPHQCGRYSGVPLLRREHIEPALQLAALRHGLRGGERALSYAGGPEVYAGELPSGVPAAVSVALLQLLR